MPFRIEMHRRVVKRLQKVPLKHREQILSHLRSLNDNPRPQDCIKLKTPLEGYRITIGEYRALFTLDDENQIVRIYLIIQRGEGYPD